MLSVAETITKLMARVPAAPEVEKATLLECHDRVVSQDIISPIDSPPFDNSQMDGYALNSDDWLAGKYFDVSMSCAAGEPQKQLSPHTVAQIFTGAVIPIGADCVVMQENVTELAQKICIAEQPMRQQYIRTRGFDVLQGACIVKKGTRLTSRHIGLIASVGIDQIDVYKPLNLCVLASGDELVEPGTPLQDGKIYNSNIPLITSMLREWGYEVTFKKIPDNLEVTIKTLKEMSAKSNVVISTGGVSVGKYDYLRRAISNIAEVISWKVRMKPGKPFVFAQLDDCFYFGLPGNPASAMVTLNIFAKPFLQSAQGETKAVNQDYAYVQFDFKAGERLEYLRVRVVNENGMMSAYMHEKQESNAVTALAWANALAEIKEECSVKQGDKVPIVWLK